MVSVEDIRGQFELFNIDPTSDVTSKCLELCRNYNVDAEELVEQWFAYTTSTLKGAAPTVEYLERMERKEFMKNKDQSIKRTSTAVVMEPDNDEMVVVNEPTTPVSKKRTLEPEPMEILGTPGTPSINYSKRTDKRSVRCSYGAKEFKKGAHNLDILVKPVYDENTQSKGRFMYEILGKRGRCINNMTEDLISAIEQKYGLSNENNEEKVEENTIFFGRIVSDSDGKINNQSVLLELTQRNKGNTLNLNLSKVSKYSLFPGQVVGVKGSYEKTAGKKRDKVLVEQVYSETTFNVAPEMPISNGSIQLVIACGPFTTQDNLLFEPLQDLLQYVKECKPNVLLLAGPFYDSHHPGIMNGELRQTFDSFFFDMVDMMIMKSVEGMNVHVIIVSSQKEPHHFAVYPTPPYEIRQKYENLTFLPDPAMVNVNGLVIGATTADILFDIGNFEICMDKTNSGPPDRMGRLASHLLKQQSFYPLDPPGKEMCIDMSLMEVNGTMGVKPHILVLPSNLRHFIKEIDSCLVINPERLTKGTGGGTFARVQVDGGSTMTVCGRSTCHIVKI